MPTVDRNLLRTTQANKSERAATSGKAPTCRHINFSTASTKAVPNGSSFGTHQVPETRTLPKPVQPGDKLSIKLPPNVLVHPDVILSFDQGRGCVFTRQTDLNKAQLTGELTVQLGERVDKELASIKLFHPDARSCEAQLKVTGYVGAARGENKKDFTVKFTMPLPDAPPQRSSLGFHSSGS